MRALAVSLVLALVPSCWWRRHSSASASGTREDLPQLRSRLTGFSLTGRPRGLREIERERRRHAASRTARLSQPVLSSLSAATQETETASPSPLPSPQRDPLTWQDSHDLDTLAISCELQDPPSLVWQLTRPHLPRIVLGLFLATAASVCSCSLPLCFSRVIDSLLKPTADSQFFAALGRLLFFYVTEPLISFLYVRTMSTVVSRVIGTLRQVAFARALTQSVAFFDEQGASDVAALISTSMVQMKESLAVQLDRTRGPRAALDIVVAFVILVRIAPRMAPVFAFLIPLSALFVNRMARRVLGVVREENAASSKESVCLQETLRNIREVKVFRAEEREMRRYSQRARETARCVGRVSASKGLFEASTRASIYASLFCLATGGGFLVRAGKLAATTLFSFIGFSFTLNFAFQGLYNTLADLRLMGSVMKKLWDCIGLPLVAPSHPASSSSMDSSPSDSSSTSTTKLTLRQDVTDRKGDESSAEGGDWEEIGSEGGAGRDVLVLPVAAGPCTSGGIRLTAEDFKGEVEFSDVHFAYPSRPLAKVLNGLRLRLPAGKTTALVGSSGSGKSTVAALLCRFYAPDSGQVFLDGVDLRNLEPDWFCSLLAVVGQSPGLFSGTVADNIAYGSSAAAHLAAVKDGKGRLPRACPPFSVPSGVSEEEVERAAKLVGLSWKRALFAFSSF
mmetsp:Transcript_55766/g.109168  ORF Transcript_55766/g.109168 Transcript_55766/m.109168 type:complete len:680 (-) Transcript_55766:818-2857(-)